MGVGKYGVPRCGILDTSYELATDIRALTDYNSPIPSRDGAPSAITQVGR